MAFGQPRIEYKTNAQMRTMHEAGLVLSRALDAAVAAAAPGKTTKELDAVFAAVLKDAGATSNFLGYHGFPATICTSVNEEVVHGIPGGRVLQDGDILSIDGGAIVDGWHSDSARTVIVGTADPEDQRLSDVTEAAMWHGIAALATGKFVGDIGNAVDDYVSSVPGQAAGHPRGLRGPRDRLRDAHGPGRAELPHQPPRAQDPARGCAWPSSRCWSAAASKPPCWTTTGPLSPRTASGPASGSTPWPSTRRASGCCRRPTGEPRNWPRSASCPSRFPKARTRRRPRRPGGATSRGSGRQRTMDP